MKFHSGAIEIENDVRQMANLQLAIKTSLK